MPIEEIEQDFPGLQTGEWRVTSDADEAYNCIAFAVHDTRQFWDPSLVGVRGYYWPPGVSREDNLQSWIRALEMNSYMVCDSGELESGGEKIVIYVDTDGVPQHVARQLPDGKWTSKLGKGEDIQHDSLESLEGGFYGKAAVFMMRRSLTANAGGMT